MSFEMRSSPLATSNAFVTINTKNLATDKDSEHWLELVQAVETHPHFDAVSYSKGGAQAILLELGVAFIAGGAFSSLIQLLVSYLKKYENRELAFRSGERSVTIKGRSPEEELKLLYSLFPELNDAKAGDGHQVRIFIADETDDLTWLERDDKSP